MPRDYRRLPDDCFDPRPGDKKEEPDELVGDDFRYAQELYNRGMDVTYPRETVLEALEADAEDALAKMQEGTETVNNEGASKYRDKVADLELPNEIVTALLSDPDIVDTLCSLRGTPRHRIQRKIVEDWISGKRDTLPPRMWESVRRALYIKFHFPAPKSVIRERQAAAEQRQLQKVRTTVQAQPAPPEQARTHQTEPTRQEPRSTMGALKKFFKKFFR